MKVASILVHSLILFAVSTFASFADDFPSKPIKIIVPFPPGGSADIGARKLAPLLSQRIGQSVIVENRPGAAGNIGTALVAQATPDGYTLGYLITTTMCVNPHVYTNVGYDPLKSFQPLSLAFRAQGILVVRKQSPIGSVADLIQQAKAQPGKLTHASAGAGSPQHFMAERLKQLAGIDLAHIPYKGEAQFLPDVLSGQIDATFMFPPSALPQIQSGKLRALGVGSAQRHPVLPDVPTLAEAGVKGFNERGWAIYAAPAGTPAERVRKLYEAFSAALRSAEYKAYLDSVGYELVASSPEDAATEMRSDYERYGKIVKELSLRLE